MSARTPTEHASAAAESIRQLNHALYAGFAEPSDAYSTVGGLSHLVMMLPQALTMIRDAVQDLEIGGHLYSDRDDLAEDLDGAYEGLGKAADDARALYESIGRAHAGLSHIGLEVGE
jgi:hypothetical protein